MKYTVNDFISYVEEDLNGLIEEISNDVWHARFGDEEKKAMRESYVEISKMFSVARAENSDFGNANVTTTENLLLEYKLPGVSSWCDLVLLGNNQNEIPQVVVVELKNWKKNSTDKNVGIEGMIGHATSYGGLYHQHPCDQVKGYAEYCKYFHSAVQTFNAEVDGYAYFTQNIDLNPYKEYPNDKLVEEYPCFNITQRNDLAKIIAKKISKKNDNFATEFVNGIYKQNREILLQVANNFNILHTIEKPFVLLDKQRESFNLVMADIKKKIDANSSKIADTKKKVFIIKGGPGTGKSAVAINLWIEAVQEYYNYGNIVFVSTSGSQHDNWAEIFKRYGDAAGSENFVIKVNSFSPGMTGTTMKEVYYPIFSKKDKKYIADEKTNRLKNDYYEDYTNYMIEKGYAKNYAENHYFISVVDEAHALLNPISPVFSGNKFGGWCLQMGPQAYHVIRQSQVSVFLMDGRQSFRNWESTSIEDIKTFAKKMDAEVEEISLDGLQFRCSGSQDYIEWMENIFSENPIRNASKWNGNPFKLNMFDSPFKMHEYLKSKEIGPGESSVRLVSSYSVKWVSGKTLDMMHSGKSEYDFKIHDKETGQIYKNYWNNPNGYHVFVQAPDYSKMYTDPLCEIGCPYVVRGFDWDYIGLFWLNDLVYRKETGWNIVLKNVFETGIASSIKYAREEQKKFYGRNFNIETCLIPVNNPAFPAGKKLFDDMVQAYRILLTRGIKEISVFIEDEETREYIKSLLV